MSALEFYTGLDGPENSASLRIRGWGMKPGGVGHALSADDRRVLFGLLALAFLLRLCAVFIMGIHHPDELWQYLEPAYKLVTGRWVEAWDFRSGIRSWLVPIAITPAVWLGHTLAPESLWHVYLPRIELTLLSLSIVWTAWTIGYRLSRTHAIIAAFVAATWVEFVHFAPRTMSEPIAVALIFPAFVFLGEDGRKKLIISGLLFGLAVAVRLQYAPAVAALVLLGTGKRWRCLPWVIAGGIGGLLIDGIANAIAGETPFYWMIENFRINVLHSKSAEFGTGPWYQYPFKMLYTWNFLSGAIIIFAGFGARRFPILAAVAIINILFHSLIPHKEYRFIFLSSALIIFLAAIGTAEIVQLTKSSRARNTGVACATWVFGSVFAAVIQPMRGYWHGSQDLLETLVRAGSQPQVCGLATYQLGQPLSVAYTFYNRDTPIFGFKGADARREITTNAHHFNVIIANEIWGSQLGSEYRLDRCSRPNPFMLPFCVYHREGSCTPPTEDKHEINRLLIRYGK